MQKTLFVAFMCMPIFLPAQEYAPAGDRIMTKWSAEVGPDNVWQEYPRPQLVRNKWVNLNGLWDYALQGKTDPKPTVYQGKILVPFCIESALSGVRKSMMPGDRLWYRRVFSLPGDWNGDRVMLNFEAVDG